MNLDGPTACRIAVTWEPLSFMCRNLCETRPYLQENAATLIEMATALDGLAEGAFPMHRQCM